MIFHFMFPYHHSNLHPMTSDEVIRGDRRKEADVIFSVTVRVITIHHKFVFLLLILSSSQELYHFLLIVLVFNNIALYAS